MIVDTGDELESDPDAEGDDVSEVGSDEEEEDDNDEEGPVVWEDTPPSARLGVEAAVTNAPP